MFPQNQMDPSQAMTMPSGLPPEPGLPQQPLAPPAPVIDPASMQALGQRMAMKFKDYATARRLAELKWTQNARQFLGIYDPDVKIPVDRSKAYPKLTRVKVVSMVSRLMNLLFPTSEKNWALGPSPVPNLPADVMQQVLNEAYQHAQENQIPLTTDLVDGFVAREALDRAANLEKEIEDQLAEIGGSRSADYIGLCRKVIYSAVMYGCGIAKGPFVRTQQQSRWTQDPNTGAFMLTTVNVRRPQYEFISLWDYYPDMTAKRFEKQEGQFIRHVMSRHQLRKLADDPSFMGSQIKEYLRDNQSGNYIRQTYETELKAMGVHVNVNDQSSSKYEILEWNGHVSAKDLVACGVEVPEENMADDIEAVLWMVGNTLIRSEINPWVELSPDEKVEMFHQFVFEEDETTLLGNGLPNIMRDSQMGVCIGTRMIFDNAAATCGPMLEMNTDLVRQDQDLTGISGFKVFYREGTGADAQHAAVRSIEVGAHIPELTSVVEMFSKFADTETFIGAATGGDMQKAPSEPMRTAAGASMLRGDAALPFKDVLRNFDLFTQSMLSSLIAFNKQFSDRKDIIGDAQVIPRGATSLMAKEMRGMALDAIAQVLTPEERSYLNSYEFVKERLAVRDVNVDAILVTEEEAEVITKRNGEAAAAAQQQQAEQIKAEIRKTLADAAKALTQSDKNTANADVARVQAMLDALEKGLNNGSQAGAADKQPQGSAQS